jgi:hypothetical protein
MPQLPVADLASPPRGSWGIGYYRRLELAAATALVDGLWRHPSLRLLRELVIEFGEPLAQADVERLTTRLPRTIRALALRRPLPATVVMRMAVALPRLRRLELHHPAEPVDHVMDALDPDRLPRIEELAIEASVSFDAVCSRLRHGWGQRLTRLALRRGQLHPRGAEALARALDGRTLDELDVTRTRCNAQTAARLVTLCRELVGVNGSEALAASPWVEHTGKPEWGRGTIVARRDNKLEIDFEHAGKKVLAANARFLRTVMEEP